MKITFQPLDDPAPVRPADMPEGVAFEYEFGGMLHIGINDSGFLCSVDRDGNPWIKSWSLQDAPAAICVLRRRDGKPLPGPEPVRHRRTHLTDCE